MTLLENIIAVEVPEGANHRTFFDNCMVLDFGKPTMREVKFPPGNWAYLFCTADASEQQIQDSGLVDYMEVDLGEMGIYKKWLNYENGQYELDTAKESLQSLLSSKGLKKNYAVLKKII